MRLLAAVLVLAARLAAQNDTFLLRGATVHPVTGPEIAGATILVKDGKIEEIGARVTVPKGLPVLDRKGLHVYPGLIDSATTIGLTEIGSVRETSDTTELGDYNPQLRAVVAVNPASDHFGVTRANGILTALTLPSGGVISGQAALLHLDGWTWEEMAVHKSAAMVLQFPTIGAAGSRFPRSSAARAAPFSEARREYEQKIARLREFLETGRRYARAKSAAVAGFQPDHKLEALLPVLNGTMPLLVVAARERAIRDAIQLAEKEKLKIVLAGARDAWKLAAELKTRDIAVIVPSTLELPMEEDDPYDKAYTLPAELHSAGVRFAFGSFSTSAARNLPYSAAMAVAFGLPRDAALKALTITAAQIWGVADRTGSIEKGKWADLIVTDGDPLETRCQIRDLFIQGRRIDPGDNKHQKLYDRYRNRP